MEVKAIMCDIDGTLLTTAGTVSPLTADAIQKVRDKGNPVWYFHWKSRYQRSETSSRNGDFLTWWDAIVGSGGAEIYRFWPGPLRGKLPPSGPCDS